MKTLLQSGLEDPPTTFGNSLQPTVIPDTNKEVGQVCRKCRSFKPLAEFYRKLECYDARCKACVLNAKASAYKLKRRQREREDKQITWNEVVVTETDEHEITPEDRERLKHLLRDFMMEVILDAS